MSEQGLSEDHEMIAGADVRVAPEGPVQMWRAGLTEPVTVSSRDVAEMQRQGWLLRSIEDLPDLLARVEHEAQAFVTNVKAFVAGVTDDGFIDTADGATWAAAGTARSMLEQSVAELFSIISQAYPTRRSDVEPLTASYETQIGTDEAPRTEIVEFQHDPSQYPLIDPEGNPRAVDPAQVERLKSAGWHELS